MLMWSSYHFNAILWPLLNKYVWKAKTDVCSFINYSIQDLKKKNFDYPKKLGTANKTVSRLSLLTKNHKNKI